eukprot:sb/3467030/
MLLKHSETIADISTSCRGRTTQEGSAPVDTSCDGFVDWNEFCTYMLLQYQEKDAGDRRKAPFKRGEKYVRDPVSKETVTRVCFASNPSRYLSITRDGCLSMWSMKLDMQKSMQVCDTQTTVSFFQGTGGTQRKQRLWVTDMVVMENVNKLVITTTSRDMFFYDMSTKTYSVQFLLFGPQQETRWTPENILQGTRAGISNCLIDKSYYILSKLCDCDHLATARAIIRGTWRSPCRLQLGTKGKFNSARAFFYFCPDVLLFHPKRYSASGNVQENCCWQGAGYRKLQITPTRTAAGREQATENYRLRQRFQASQ